MHGKEKNREMKINPIELKPFLKATTREFLILMILASLMFAQAFLPLIGLADSGSRIIYCIWIIGIFLFLASTSSGLDSEIAVE